MRIGLIDSSPCGKCRFDKKIARIKGCDGQPAPKPTREEIYEDKLILHWNCPSKFIPLSVRHWYEMYTYQQDFPGSSMPSWGQQTAKWLKFYRYFTVEYAKLQKEKHRLEHGR